MHRVDSLIEASLPDSQVIVDRIDVASCGETGNAVLVELIADLPALVLVEPMEDSD